MTDITLYGLAGSTYLRTVQMVCLHKQLPYTLKPLDWHSESHRAKHPFLRMPVMKHGDIVLFETLAICSYLENRVPEPRLLPTAPLPKARALQWISAYIDYLCPVLIHGKPDGERQNWPNRTDEYLEILNTELSTQPFLAGDVPTLADLFLSPAIDYALGGRGFDNKLANYPHLVSWWQKASRCTTFEQTQVA